MTKIKTTATPRQNKAMVLITGSPKKSKASPKGKGKNSSLQVTGAHERQKTKFLCRMSPAGLFQFIESRPSEQQLSDIESLGFSGLMQLSTDYVPGKLARWLLSTFDPLKCSLMDGALILNDLDVHLTTGLPIGTISIKEGTTRTRDAAFLSEKSRWLSQFGGVDKVSKKTLLEKMMSQREGGDDFKKNFLVFVTSTFLMGVAGETVSLRILNCLQDLSKVSSFNWCGFTLRHLGSSISRWQQDKEKYFGGPVMVLVFIYLDRVFFKCRTVERVFPTLSKWTKSDISSRVSDEADVGFGTGAIHDRLVHSPPECKSDAPREAVVSNEEDVDVMGKLKTVAMEFAHSYSNFSTVLKEAQVVEPNSEFVRLMSSLSQGITDGYSKVSHDDVKEAEAVPEADMNNDDQKNEELRTEFDGWTDEELIAIMVEFEKSFGTDTIGDCVGAKRKKRNEPSPSCTELKPDTSFCPMSVSGLDKQKKEGKQVDDEVVVKNFPAFCVPRIETQEANVDLLGDGVLVSALEAAAQPFNVVSVEEKDNNEPTVVFDLISEGREMKKKKVTVSNRRTSRVLRRSPRLNCVDHDKEVEGRVDSQEPEMPSFKLIDSQEFVVATPAVEIPSGGDDGGTEFEKSFGTDTIADCVGAKRKERNDSTPCCSEVEPHTRFCPMDVSGLDKQKKKGKQVDDEVVVKNFPSFCVPRIETQEANVDLLGDGVLVAALEAAAQPFNVGSMEEKDNNEPPVLFDLISEGKEMKAKKLPVSNRHTGQVLRRSPRINCVDHDKEVEWRVDSQEPTPAVVKSPSGGDGRDAAYTTDIVDAGSPVLQPTAFETNKDDPILISPTVLTPLVPSIHSGSNNDSPILISPTVLPSPSVLLCPPPTKKHDQPSGPTRRNLNPSAWFRSPFLVRNADVFASLTQAEKDISDYAFSDLDESEILYITEPYSLTRADLKTLLFGKKVAESVMDAWCDILNHQEKFRDPNSPFRLFLGSRTLIDEETFDYNGVTLVFVPIVTPTPILYVVNLRSSVVDVVYPMRVVDYIPLLQYVEARLVSHLGHKIRKDLSMKSFKINTFIPKSNIGNRIDCGIHLMRHMETYKGKRLGYKSSLTDDSCLKRLSVKYCHLILTFDENDSKTRILEASRNFRIKPCPEDIMKFVESYDSRKEQDTIIDTDWIEITMRAIRSLKPGLWVMDMIIDLIGIRTCLASNNFLYLPSIVKNVRFERPKSLYTQYVKMHYIPKDGSQVTKVFLPIYNDDHWFASIIDLEKKRTFILDSLASKRTQRSRQKFVAHVIFNVERVIIKDNGYDKLEGISKFVIEHLPVPQQANGYDCGVHVMKWIEAANDEDLWTEKSYFQELDQYRHQKMIELLLWEKNKRKVFV